MFMSWESGLLYCSCFGVIQECLFGTVIAFRPKAQGDDIESVLCVYLLQTQKKYYGAEGSIMM